MPLYSYRKTRVVAVSCGVTVLRESETSLPHAHARTYAAHTHTRLGEIVIVGANLHFSSNNFLSYGLIVSSFCLWKRQEAK